MGHKGKEKYKDIKIDLGLMAVVYVKGNINKWTAYVTNTKNDEI